MKYSFKELFEIADKFASSQDPNDRIYGASLMKEIHEIGLRLALLQPEHQKAKDDIKAVQEKIKARIEEI